MAAGATPILLRPKLWWAPLGTELPSLSLPYGGDYPAGWQRITDTAAGLAVTPRNAKEAYNSEENGAIMYVPTGDFGISFALEDRKPTWDFAMRVQSFKSNTIAADTTAGTPETVAYYVDQSAVSDIMFGFDAWSAAGSLTDEDALIRGIAFSAQQTENAENAFRHVSTDGPFRLGLALEAVPANVAASQLEGTGLTLDSVDPNRRFNYFKIEEAAA